MFGDDSTKIVVSKISRKEWFNRFKSGCTLVEHYHRSERPRTTRNAAVIEELNNLIMKEYCLTVPETSKKRARVLSSGYASPLVTLTLHKEKRNLPAAIYPTQEQSEVVRSTRRSNQSHQTHLTQQLKPP
ncbi:hypothetical protein TNCV_4379951 [Trichonephila clavipes]|nr:hypothetical protein TNCV_4379951 [Trichonephila clavipes]